MMQRLRDQRDADDWAVALAARLVASAEPTRPSEARKARVRAVLRSPVRRRSGVLRYALVTSIILALAGGAAAAVGGWVARAKRRAGAAVLPAPALPPAVRDHRGTRAWGELPASSPALAIAPSQPAVVASCPPSPAPAPRRRARAAASQPPAEEDGILVMQAMAALRRDHEPVRAGRLLADYLRLHPDGVLAEDALALALEAAVQRDDPGAGALAAHYLRRFPAGRFAATARAAQERFGGAR
jgi:hypothetical protein